MSLLNRLGRLVGPSTTDEHRYECVCGEQMGNTAVHTGKEAPDKQYRVELWECTDEDCLRGGKVYRFDDDEDSYGEGVLAGQVTAAEADR